MGLVLGGGGVIAGIKGVLLDKTKKGKVFKRGVMHDHQPSGGPASGRWAEVVAFKNIITLPNTGQQLFINDIVGAFKEAHFRDITPAELMDIVANPLVKPDWFGFVKHPIGPFVDKPIALDHLNWFLKNGNGEPLKENAILKGMLLSDSGIIRTIAADIQIRPKKDNIIEHSLKIEQQDYSNQDFQFAFGGIDTLSYLADFNEGRLDVWFIDRYEWHPHFSNMPDAYPQQHDDDEARPTNILHAACVELKAGTARDFWMVGETSTALDPFLNPPPADSLGSTDTSGGTIL